MEQFTSIEDATAAIQAHPAVASFMATPLNYVVFYPETYIIPGGITVQRAPDDLTALNYLYNQVDAWWNGQRLQMPAQ